MNIAHFTFEYPPSSTGGLGTYIEGLVNFQRDMNNTVDVFFLDTDSAPAGTIPLPFYVNKELIFYKTKQIMDLSSNGLYDIVVIHDWAGILVSQPIWKQNIPLITTCHLPLAWDVGYYSDLPCDFSDKLEFCAMSQCDLVIAVSSCLGQHLNKEYPFTRGKTKVVHNGVDLNFFTPGEKEFAPILLYVGRFVEQKGFDLIPDIFRNVKHIHPDIKLKIAGTGPLKQLVIHKLKNYGLYDSTEFYDFSPPNKILELYREAAVVLMPSRYEPFGLVAIESMATETPVVASNTGGLAEIIDNSINGFLIDHNEITGYSMLYHAFYK